MTDEDINEAVSRKLGVYPSDEAIARAKSQVTGAGTFKITIPDYCYSIEAAWEVVENMSPKICIWKDRGVWIISKTDFLGIGETLAEAHTAPMAICLAFLKLEEPV